MANKKQLKGISLVFSRFWREMQAKFKPWKDSLQFDQLQDIISDQASLFSTLQIDSPKQIFQSSKTGNQFTREASVAFMLALLNLLRAAVHGLAKRNKFDSLRTLYGQIEQVQRMMELWQGQVREYFFREERTERERIKLASLLSKKDECQNRLKEFTVKSNENLKITQQLLENQLSLKFQTIDLTLPKLGTNLLRKSCLHREKLFKLSQIQTLSLSKRPEWAKQNLLQAQRLQRLNESLMEEKRKNIINNLRNQQDQTIHKKLDYLNRRSARAQNQIAISIRNQLTTNEKKESIQTHRLYYRQSRIENDHKAANRRHSLDTERYLERCKRGRLGGLGSKLALGQSLRRTAEVREVRPSQSLCSKCQLQLS